MQGLIRLVYFAGILASTVAASVIWDGRVPFNVTNADLDTSTGPYLTVVKGSENATHYDRLLGHSKTPTPLWNEGLLPLIPREQVISVTIDNSSVFIPGGGPPQYGFRRTDLIAAVNGEHTELITRMESNTTVFHFSIQKDDLRPLNFSHEYQIVFIEPNDGSHVFWIQLGSPFTDPTGPLPDPNAHSFKVLDHALNVLFSTPFASNVWHNFAVQVDWNNRTLAVWYSEDTELLRLVKASTPNPTTALGPDGQGDFHIALLKLPIVNPADSPADQGDVVHHSIQEGTTEGLFYSGVFVESASQGVSRGFGVHGTV
ncbi:glycoside hydrolase family 131 protein [Trametes sanguinea]|nr:glycoside hydrolase family 131 protein [Trametes sanguinea]